MRAQSLQSCPALRLEAGALVAAALAAPAAQWLALRLPAQVLVPALALAFLALAPGTQVAGVALTQAADVSPVAAAPGAVGFQPRAAAAPAVVGDPHLQAVPEAHGPQGERVLHVLAGAAPGLHRHLKGRLGRRKRGLWPWRDWASRSLYWPPHHPGA